MYGDASRVAIHDMFHAPQAHAIPGFTFGGRAKMEQGVQNIRRDAASLVGYNNLDSFTAARELHLDLGPRGCHSFAGIPYKIKQNLANFPGKGLHRAIPSSLYVEEKLSGFDEWIENEPD